jgi:hypothetical protein
MPFPDEVLVIVMLYADMKTLRRLATTCKNANAMYHSNYFINACYNLTNNNVDKDLNKININRYIHHLKFGNGRYMFQDGEEEYCQASLNYLYHGEHGFSMDYNYLDNYILPERQCENIYYKDDCDRDEFIYRDEPMTREELDKELDEIAMNIANLL